MVPPDPELVPEPDAACDELLIVSYELVSTCTFFLNKVVPLALLVVMTALIVEVATVVVGVVVVADGEDVLPESVSVLAAVIGGFIMDNVTPSGKTILVRSLLFPALWAPAVLSLESLLEST